jgi:hypothetical protein
MLKASTLVAVCMQTRRSVSTRPHRLSGGMMAPQQWLHQPGTWQPPRAAAMNAMGKPAQQSAGSQRRFTIVLDLDETMVRTAKHLHAAEDDAAASVAAAAPGAFVVRSSALP